MKNCDGLMLEIEKKYTALQLIFRKECPAHRPLITMISTPYSWYDAHVQKN